MKKGVFKKKIRFSCKVCNKQVFDFKSNKTKYCTQKCYFIDMKKIENKGRFQKGQAGWNTGLTKETDDRLKNSSQTMKGRKGYFLGKKRPEHSKKMSGKNNPNWVGGKSFEPYTTKFNIKLKKLIKERDNHICQICGNKGNNIHHINYNKEDCKPENLILLCRSCHSKTNGNRIYWINYFKEMLKCS